MHSIHFFRIYLFILSLRYQLVWELDTNTNQCIPGQVIPSVTLQAGIKAGKYIEGYDVVKDIECAEQCCSETQCDVAFILGSKCFMVICSSMESCKMTPAQNSLLNPRLIFITRKNNEGVIRTLFSEDQKTPWNPNICPPMISLKSVTLKGGLASGEFTDIGPVDTLEQCYDICCQKDNCDLAFILATNCFTVSCRNNLNDTNTGCILETAVKSPFNPEAAHIYSRINQKNSLNDGNDVWPSEEPKSVQTTPSSVQKYSTQSNFLFSPNMQPMGGSTFDQNTMYNPFQSQLNSPYYFGYDDPSPYSAEKYQQPFKQITFFPENAKDLMKGYLRIDASKLAPDTYITPSPKFQNFDSDILKPKASNENINECKFGPILYNVSLKNGKKAGRFTKAEDISNNIDSCTRICCETKNTTFICEVAFFVAGSCYMVDCYDINSCDESTIAPSNYNPQLVFVRNITKKMNHEETISKYNSPTTIYSQLESKKTTNSPELIEKTTTEKNRPFLSEQVSSSKCSHEKILWNMTVKGVSPDFQNHYLSKKTDIKSAKVLAKNIKDMKICTELCCQDSLCDAAVLEDGRCLSVNCANNPRSCIPMVVKSSKNSDTQLAFMSRIEQSYIKSLISKKPVLFGMIGIGSVFLVSVIILVTIISTKSLRREKKIRFKRKKARVVKKMGKDPDRTKSEEEEEQDRLEELLSRVSASFSKNRSNR